MDDWTAAQWQDECSRIEQTIKALEAAEAAGVERQHIITLAQEAGLGELYKPTGTRNDTN